MMNGQIYIGCLFPNAKTVKYLPLEKETAGGVGHVVGIENYKPDATFTYYFGMAWSKYDMPDFNIWQETISKYAEDLKTPLSVTIK